MVETRRRVVVMRKDRSKRMVETKVKASRQRQDSAHSRVETNAKTSCNRIIGKDRANRRVKQREW